MSWWKESKQNGNDNLEVRIKDNIRKSPFFIALFKKFHIPIEKLDELKFKTERLEDEFCLANEDSIIIDDRLANSETFLNEDFHFIAHELIHWLHRQVEQKQFFADPEEIESFNAAIAFALQNSPVNAVMQKFLPLIKIHFNDDNNSREFLKRRLIDAKRLLDELKS